MDVVISRSHTRLHRNLLFDGVIPGILALFLGTDIPMCFERESLARSAGRRLSLFVCSLDCTYLSIYTVHTHITTY